MSQASLSLSQAHEILGLEMGSDMEAVRKAYKEKALRTHPDKVPEEQRGGATVEFQNVGAAYEVITKHHEGPDPDYDDFDFFYDHTPHFHFGGGRGGAFFFSGFGNDEDDFYIWLFNHVFQFPGFYTRPAYGRSVPRNRQRAPVNPFERQERMQRQREAELAKQRRAEDERKAREDRARERDAKAKAAAERKAKAGAKKQRQMDPVAVAAAEEARRVEAEKSAQEAARRSREALERPQKIRSAVFEAARKGNAEAVRKGVWEDTVDAAGPEVLPRASDLVKERPADWNKLETLLHIAVSNKDKDLVVWLIKHNAEPDERDSLGQTPFNRAVNLGNMEIILYFLDTFPPGDEDSEPVLAPPEDDNTLRLAVASTDPAVVISILDAGLANLTDAVTTWAWIDGHEDQSVKKIGGKYDKVRDVLRRIDGWTPPASPGIGTRFMDGSRSTSPTAFDQQRKKRNYKPRRQHQEQAHMSSNDDNTHGSDRPTNPPQADRGQGNRGRGGGRGGRGRGLGRGQGSQ